MITIDQAARILLKVPQINGLMSPIFGIEIHNPILNNPQHQLIGRINVFQTLDGITIEVKTSKGKILLHHEIKTKEDELGRWKVDV